MTHGKNYKSFISVVQKHIMVIFYVYSGLQITVRLQNIFLTKTYVLGAQKNQPPETIRLKSVVFWTYDLI